MTSFYGEYREKNIINDEEENRVSRANVDKWIFRLLMLVLALMPLIVMANTTEVVSPLISNISNISSGVKGDLFTNYKALFLLVVTIITGLLFLAKILFMDGKIRKTVLNYLLIFFVIAIVISTILSPNISIALNGQYNRSDGAITWLCYIALLFIALNIEYPKHVIKIVMYSFSPFIVINLITITMYFYDNDILQYEVFQKLITAFIHGGTSTLGEDSYILGTLNHGNYMSGMFAILTMMYLAGVIIEKKIFIKIINLILAIFSVLVIFMSLSTSGFLTLLCISLILIWLFVKSNRKTITILMLSIFLIVSCLSLHTLAQKNSKVWDETFGLFTSSNPYTEDVTAFSVSQFNIDKIVFGQKVSAADGKFELPVIPETGVGAGSGRIYIWEKTINLVMERPLFGYGLDTLMYNFPHNNIDARANLETETVIVDKPHNMYVGVLYGTGIIGFIIFMLIIIFLTWMVLKELFTYKATPSCYVTVLAVAWVAFLFQSIFNDSLVGLTAPYWIIIGVFVAEILDKEVANN